MTETAQELLLRFVDAIGRPEEARRYVEFFRSERPESFAIIHVSEAIMRHASDALLVDLRFLARLGLTPVVAFGAVEPDNAKNHLQLVQAQLGDVPCAIAAPGDLAAIAHDGGIALIAVPGATLADRFAWLGQTAADLLSRKLVFLGRRPGLVPTGASTPLSMIDVNGEFEQVAPQLDDKQRSLLTHARGILQRAPHPLTAAVTSPLTLLRELFTERGAGTLLRRGSAIATHAGYAGVDSVRLAEVIKSSFGRAAHPAFFDRTPLWTAIADDYRGAAVVEQTSLAPYLTKFAVDVFARGEGIGRDLWRALTAAHPRLFWRARSNNPINSWYLSQCDGMMRSAPWVVYWRGLAEDEIGPAVTLATARPTDLEPG